MRLHVGERRIWRTMDTGSIRDTPLTPMSPGASGPTETEKSARTVLPPRGFPSKVAARAQLSLRSPTQTRILSFPLGVCHSKSRPDCPRFILIDAADKRTAVVRRIIRTDGNQEKRACRNSRSGFSLHSLGKRSIVPTITEKQVICITFARAFPSKVAPELSAIYVHIRKCRFPT